MTQFKQLLFAMVLLCLGTTAFAQVKVGNNPTTINASSVLEVESTTKGFLPPRMTEAQRDAIASPAQGLVIFNTTVPCLQVNDGTPATPDWNCISGTASGSNASTNGTGAVSSYGAPACTANTVNGTMTAGTPVSGVTMSLYANVTTLGTYNLSANQNGVTFSGTGTFTALGCQLVTLTASGTPITAGATTWGTNSTPMGTATATVAAAQPPFPAGYVACNGVTTQVVEVTSGAGRIWMDRNLGAFQVATSSTDFDAYGDLFQWGRFADGHQCRASGTTTTKATTAVPNAGNSWDGLFINASSPFDWLTTNNNNLWQGVNGTNNPCPSGFRIPTAAEWNTEIGSWAAPNSTGALNSPLKLPLAGMRDFISGDVANVGSFAIFWCSTFDGTPAFANLFSLSSGAAAVGNNNRALGATVRCIKH